MHSFPDNDVDATIVGGLVTKVVELDGFSGMSLNLRRRYIYLSIRVLM